MSQTAVAASINLMTLSSPEQRINSFKTSSTVFHSARIPDFHMQAVTGN